MIKNIRNLLGISIISAIATIGMGYLLVYYLQKVIIDFGEFLNALMAMIILILALAGTTIVYFVEVIRLVITSAKKPIIANKYQ